MRRFFLGSLVASLGLSNTSCHLSDLFNAGAPGKLAVTPTHLADTLSAGTSTAQTKNLSITSDHSGTGWRAAVAGGSGWLQLSRSQDTVPATLNVMFSAGGLGAGTYRDTIQLTSMAGNGDVVRVPVVFMVRVVDRPPDAPSGLGQFHIDGTTSIDVGGVTTERTVILQGTVTDPDAGDSILLQAEVEPIGIPFSNVPNASGVAVASGSVASAAASGLTDYTSYHWQARALDRSGNASAWVSFGGNSESEADFRAVLPPAQMVFLTPPTNSSALAAIAPPVRVVVQDAGGSTLTYYSGNVTIAIAANPSTAPLRGTKTQPFVNGIATFPDLEIDRVGTGYTLAASSPGLPSVVSGPVDVTAGGAATLAFSVQPATTAAGAAITPPVRVSALDSSGNVATAFSGTVTIVIGQNPSDGHLTGLAKVNAANGVATFSNLTIDSAGTGYTLQATATGLTAVTSDSFNVTAGAVAADKSSVTVFPKSIAASTPGAGSTTATITVTARDHSGNVVSGAAVTVLADGAFNTFTPATGNTDTLGVFTATISSTKAQTENISATINGVAVTQKAALTVTPGAASALVFTQQPGSTPATMTITPAVLVAVRDSFNNTVTGFATAITVAIGTNPSGGTLSGATSHIPTNGVATFNNLAISKAGVGYTLTAAANGLPTDSSTTFNIN